MTATPIRPLVRAVAAALTSRDSTLATAESITGGSIAAACTSEPGSSHWFECGFVAYRLRAKTALLGVPADLLERHGAVSEATARAMADGALARCGAHVVVAATGAAGPERQGTAPVGTVWIAWATRDANGSTTTCASRYQLSGSRTRIRSEVVRLALAGVLDVLAN